ncbi:MAG: ABC transporter permease [Firmicutes bacterium]|nr:ABC transporter permease [Bacillota bacterium]
MKKVLSLKNIIISFVIFILLWQVLYMTSNFGDALFPSPLKAWKAFVEMVKDGSIFVNIGTSMYRFAAGYISSVIVAVLLGLVLGWFKGIFKYINPVVQLLRPISPMAWMPFIVLWFGIGDVPAIVIIFIAAFFPVLLSTVAAVGNIDPIYLKVSKNFGIGKPEIFWKIVFPAAFPQIANSIHLALGTAWVFLVAGEMVGSQSGLGYLIIDARNNLRADVLMATIIVIGIIGLILDSLLKLIERSVMQLWGGAAE